MDIIKKQKIRSWASEYTGRFNLILPKNLEDIKTIISHNNNLITSGGLRSYGDSAINLNILNSKNLNKILHFDEANGILTAEAGITINEMINYLIPRGWFLMVTPGTKFATLGGCIASDVHGKEHHKYGCFSESVIKMKLLLNKSDFIEFSKETNRDLFRATCGGMGLTGFIYEATIKCKKINSSQIKYNKTLNENLDNLFKCFDKHSDANYSVAWLDTKKRNNGYRSVFSYGSFSENNKFNLIKERVFKISMKIKIINLFNIFLFNNFYYYWNKINKKKGLVEFNKFFYPLDKLENWFKLYGNEGFIQYQFIIPKQKGKEGIELILNYLNKNNFTSSLAVLKLYGDQNENYLSFPLKGYSLAMDFPINDQIYNILNKLDEIILKFNGKIYLTKDKRLNSKFFKDFYPNYKEVNKVKKKYNIYNFKSIQSERLEIDE